MHTMQSGSVRTIMGICRMYGMLCWYLHLHVLRNIMLTVLYWLLCFGAGCVFVPDVLRRYVHEYTRIYNVHEVYCWKMVQSSGCVTMQWL